MITAADIYNEINRHADFSKAEKWDNCGILAGEPYGEVTRIITALDITSDVIEEARRKGAELIVSHHPVIFSPLKVVMSDTAPAKLIRYGITAICCHTPFDMSPEGMNKGLFELLGPSLGLKNGVPLEEIGEGMSIGMIYDMETPLSPKETAERIKTALGCSCVRFTDGGKSVKRLAVSSGAGNDFAELALKKGADALASGDIKHDRFVFAADSGFTLIDCGHFHTERIFCRLMKDILEKAFPQLDISEAESCIDPVKYV